MVKILSLTRIYQEVESAGIWGSVQWILKQQQSDGSFTDSHPVYHREMQVRSWFGPSGLAHFSTSFCDSRCLRINPDVLVLILEFFSPPLLVPRAAWVASVGESR